MNWKNMPTSHKIATIISGIAAVFAVLPGMLEQNPFPIDTFYPAIAVFTLCEAVIYWEKKRKWAYLYIAGTVITLACCAMELFL